MDTHDIVLLLGFVLLMVIVLPRLTQLLRPRNVSSEKKTPAPAPVNAVLEDVKEDLLQLPKPAGKADKSLVPEPDMISKYYENTRAREDVPEQHCAKPIGACPDSKPMSTDLPLGNVPMCVATRAGDNMRLRSAMSVSV